MRTLTILIACLFLNVYITNAQCTDLFFSEYIEGSSNNKALELYNPTNAPVDLSNYIIYRYNNGSSSPSGSLVPSGILAPYDVYVIANASADPAVLAVADTTHSITFYNGDDALMLKNMLTGDTLDIIGVIGVDPGSSWPVGSGSTAEHTLVRMNTVQSGTTDWTIGATQWDVYPQNTFTFLGSHSSVCGSGGTNPVITIAPPAQTVNEGDTALVVVSIANANNNPTQFDLTVSSFSTAMLNSDFTVMTGTYTFPANSTTPIEIPVVIIDDTLTEGSEFIGLLITNATNNATINNDSASIVILPNDSVFPLYTIAQVRTYNPATCDHDSVGVRCRLTGTVIGLNYRPSGLQFYMHDGTGGINVFNFSGNLGYNVTQGDSIIVTGMLDVFNGLLEIIPSRIDLITTGANLPSPIAVTSLNEDLEGEFVVFRNCWLVDSTAWTGTGSGFNVQFTNGTDTLEFRIDNDMPFYSMPAPAGKFDITGIVTQFDNTSPYCEGYQIFPVEFIPIPPCEAPTNLRVTRITPVSVRLNWNNVQDALSYQIRGRTISGSNWVYLNIPSGSVTFRDVYGLYNNVTYVWQIRTNCPNETSPWSVLDTFTTGCQAPDSIWTFPVTSNAAQLNWKRASGAYGYEIRGQKVGGPFVNFLIGSGNTTSKQVFGLQPNTSYAWRVRTICDPQGNIRSVYTALDTFVTASGSRLATPDPFDQQQASVSIYPNPASGYINVITEIQNMQVLTIRDMAGKVVLKQQMKSGSNGSIDVQNLAPGIYYLELEGTGTIHREKLVIQ